ncbi:MAG: hypothetical protein Q8R53_01260 [Nanoarchaeota archaeon]|nr:hypothetical protein [Nanoarchaeota archaeon]
METCDECKKGKLRKKSVEYVIYGKGLGNFPALVCDRCNETLFAGETFFAIERQAKQKGVWGIAAKTRIGTSGNSLDVKIPKPVVDFLGLRKGQEVVIEPLGEKKFQVSVVSS